MCQNTMQGNGWVSSDLLPGVKMMPSGAVAVLDFQHRGYEYILPWRARCGKGTPRHVPGRF